MAPRKSRQRPTSALSLPGAAAAGLAATVGMDLVARIIVAPALHMAPLGPDNLGRWIGHMREGRFTHQHIETAKPVPHEAAIGVVAHYLIGPTLGVGYGLLLRRARPPRGSVRLGTAYGIATTALPWLIVYPAHGWGPMGLRAGGPKLAAFALLNHVIYGFGLGIASRGKRHKA